MASFVTRQGTHFVRDGQPFRIAGANNYYLPYAPLPDVVAVFRLAQEMGLNTLRTWAFLDCDQAASGQVPSGALNEVFFRHLDKASGCTVMHQGPNGWERLDRVIALAEEYGMLLILPFVNYWPDMGGMPQYARWLEFKDVHEFYIDPRAKTLYREAVKHLVTRVNLFTGRRYRDEPSILAWELANEPRYPAQTGWKKLGAWVSEMGAYVKSLDKNHLLGVGDEGYFRRPLAFGQRLYNGSHGVDCELFLGVQAVDFGTYHYYPSYSGKKEPVEFGRRWIREHLAAGARANKPMILEEFGWRGSAPEREVAFRAWLKELSDAQAAGGLAWMIAGEMENGQLYPDYDGYTIYSRKECPSLVEYAQAFSTSGGGEASSKRC